MKSTKFYRRFGEVDSSETWKEDTGYSVTIPGWKDVEVFVHGESGCWQATEGRSGLLCMMGSRSTIKAAVEAVKIIFDTRKDTVYSSIKSAVNNNGVSPLYAQTKAG